MTRSEQYQKTYNRLMVVKNKIRNYQGSTRTSEYKNLLSEHDQLKHTLNVTYGKTVRIGLTERERKIMLGWVEHQIRLYPDKTLRELKLEYNDKLREVIENDI